MRFQRHSELEGKHSFMSASKSSWIRYSPEKILEKYAEQRAAIRGTELHAFAHEAVRLGIEMRNTNQTINMYVNDCIGHRMQNEVSLMYMPKGVAGFPLAFSTADAINFRRDPDDSMVLYIFDLKTGKIPAHGEQLMVYAAFFCLEYNQRPFEIKFDLRLYQNDDIGYVHSDPEEIAHIMNQIVQNDKLIREALDAQEV